MSAGLFKILNNYVSNQLLDDEMLKEYLLKIKNL